MAVPKVDLKPLSFVVVDDEVAILNLIGALLVNSGVKKVHKCKSAQEAQNILTDANVSIDCIVSDHSMQPVTGLELLQKIRAGNNLGVSRNLRFVMLTGHGDEEVVRAALALDVDAYVMKPVSQGGLISSIDRAFARKRMLKSGPDYEAIALPGSPAAS
ncbi:MAG: response regulator [Alphaproteobacteria bacterium]|nr:response regulator [Alphaproteobacteria bacterium]